jgi:serine/threonine protein kinase
VGEGNIIVDPALGEPKAESQDLLIGQLLGGYQVVSRIGAGGMGTVYAAQHQRIGRKAAVKVLQSSAAADDEWRKRFLTEAEALASLKHRNLVDVYEFGDLPDGRQYLMMEFLEGEPLDRYISKHAPMPPAQALGIAEQILNGLGEAHKKGIVHRDLKPANVMLLREHSGELQVKVLDFGLARQNAVPLAQLAHGARAEQASLAAGTPEYIAPEQAQAQQVDGTADLYSLGVMLYEMLSGRLPFESTSVSELLQKHLSERPQPLSSVAGQLPEGVEDFVHSLLEKDPLVRPQSADLARQHVQRLLKRMAAEATTIRPRPSNPSAPTQQVGKPGPRTDIVAPVRDTEKVQRTGPTTDLSVKAALPAPKRTPMVVGALVVLALIGFGVSRLISGRTEQVTPPPTVDVKPPEVAKTDPPPEPVKVEPFPVVEPPIAVVDAGVAPVKVVVKDTPTKPTVKIEAESNCEPDAEWRKGELANLQELMTAASKVTDADFLISAAGTEDKLSTAINAATTRGDCSAIARQLAEFGRAIKKAGNK